MSTRGGVASFVRVMAGMPIWSDWNVHHVATHRDGNPTVKVGTFAAGLVNFVFQLIFRRPDVVHLHMASYGSFFRKYLLHLLARLFRVPVVVHIHGAEFDLFYEKSPRWVQWAIRDSLTHASVVVALGRSWVARLSAIAPTARIVAVPNSVQAQAPITQPGADEPVHVLFLGRVGDRKGTFALIEAWAAMLADIGTEYSAGRIPARLTIAGDGEVERARALVTAKGLDDSVDVLGWIPSDTVPQLLRTAQVLALPSHNEGQPMAILESMANGLCVLSSPVGGITDLIDETCGVLVPPGDVDKLAAALGWLVRDDDARTRLGSAALQRVREDFDADVLWRKFDELYRELQG